MASQRFTKARRLRRRAEFQRVFETGRRLHSRFFTVLVASNEAGGPRLGIVASKKLGDSVRRNLAKRLIREVFRQNTPLLDRQGVDIVVIPRRELFDAAYSSLENDFRTVLRRRAIRLPTDARR